VLKEANIMNWFWDTMIGYWVLLLAISLGAAAVIYVLYLKDTLF